MRSWTRALVAAAGLGCGTAWAGESSSYAPPPRGGIETLDEDTAIALDTVFLKSDRWHTAGLLSIPGTLLGVGGLVLAFGDPDWLGGNASIAVGVSSGVLLIGSGVAYTGNGLAQGMLAVRAAELSGLHGTDADVAFVGGVAGVITWGSLVGWIGGRRAIQRIRRDLGFAGPSLRVAPMANGVALVGRF